MNIDLIANNQTEISVDVTQVEINLDISQGLNLELIKTPINIRGESAYEIAVRNGFIGTENEWLDSLKTSTLNWNSTNW